MNCGNAVSVSSACGVDFDAIRQMHWSDLPTAELTEGSLRSERRGNKSSSDAFSSTQSKAEMPSAMAHS